MKIEELNYDYLYENFTQELLSEVNEFYEEEDIPSTLIEGLTKAVRELIEDVPDKIMIGHCPHCYLPLKLSDIERGQCQCLAVLEITANKQIVSFLSGEKKPLA